MGACAASIGGEQSAASRAIDKQLRNANKQESEKVKLLLLGAGQCGKSTFFKQIKELYGKGLTQKDKEYWTGVARHNCVTMMRELVEGAISLGIEIDGDAKDTVMKFMELDVDDTEALPSSTAEMMTTIWNSSAAKQAYERRHEFQLDDSFIHWAGKIKQLADPSYLADREDILRCRVRTTGVVEDEYVIEGTHFIILDVGGQRTERSKWMHCFDQVTAIVFMFAMSGFNQVLVEDHTTNRIYEAKNLLWEMSHLACFQNTQFIIFANKFDLFLEKIETNSLRNDEKGWFDGSVDEGKGAETKGAPAGAYEGDSPSEARQYLKKLLVAQLPKGKQIHYHETVATDTSNMRTAFEAVRSIIFQQNMSSF